MSEVTAAERRNGDLAIASVLLALLSGAGTIALPSWTFLTLPLGIVALALAAAGLILPRRARGPAIVGLVVSVLACALSAASLISAADDLTQASADQASPEAMPELEFTGTTVVYEVLTDGLSVTHLSYVDVIDGQPQMTEKLGVPAPFTHEVRIPEGTVIDVSELSVTGMGGATSINTRCIITIDGVQVASQSSKGAYSLVNCVAQTP